MPMPAPDTRPAWRLAGILLLAAAIRVVAIGSLPAGPNQDEAANVVEARCLAQTGSDSYGRWLPLYLRAYEDYREAAFVYLATPLVLLLPDELSALRLVAAAVGVLTVWLTYRLGRQLFGTNTGLWASLWLATNPQHVFWSRIGMEIVLVPLAGSLAILVYATREQHAKWGPTLVGLALSLVLYSGMMGKGLAAMLLMVFLFDVRSLVRDARQRPGPFLAGVGALVIGSIPAWVGVFTGSGVARFNLIRLHADSAFDLAVKVLNNYVVYLSPSYLLLGGGEIDPTYFPHAAMLGYAEFACLLIGVGFTASTHSKWAWLLLLLVLLHPLPAAFTSSISPSRVLIAVPGIQLIAGYGASRLVERIGQIPTASVLGIGLLLTASLVVVDLIRFTNEHVDELFGGPVRRGIHRALHEAEGRDLVFVDAVLPFAPTYCVYFANPEIAQFQGRLDAAIDRGVRLSFDNVIVAFPPAVRRPSEKRRVFLVTLEGRPVPPGARLVAGFGHAPMYGNVALFQWMSSEDEEPALGTN